jgi:hypothetical protein
MQILVFPLQGIKGSEHLKTDYWLKVRFTYLSNRDAKNPTTQMSAMSQLLKLETVSRLAAFRLEAASQLSLSELLPMAQSTHS